MFVTRIGVALGIVSSYLTGVQFGGIGGALLRILVECVPLALAVFFVFRADRVVDLVDREKAPIV